MFPPSLHQVIRCVAFILLALTACAQRGTVSEDLRDSNSQSLEDIAVVVTVEDYKCKPASRGAGHLASEWSSFFRRDLSASSSDLLVLRDADVTPELLRETVSRATNRATENTRLWFVFVGHGAARTEESDGVLVTSKTELTHVGYLQERLTWGTLLTWLAEGEQAETVAIFDTSFADEARDGFSLAYEDMLDDFEPTALPEDSSSQIAVLAAASDDDRVGYTPDSEEPAFGLLLISALQQGIEQIGGELTADKLADYARTRSDVSRYETKPTALGNTDWVLPRLQDHDRENEKLGDVVPPAKERNVRPRVDQKDEPDVEESAMERQEELEKNVDVPNGYAAIPAGTFEMGSPECEPGRWYPEKVARRFSDSNSPKSLETQHSVTLTRPYAMKQTEVTQGEWKELMGDNPAFFSECGDECPVERVSWYDAVAYLNKLSKSQDLEPCYALNDCSGSVGTGCPIEEASAGPLNNEQFCYGGFHCEEVRFEGLSCEGYRLPTEAEWEYAARGGTQTATYIGDFKPGAVDTLSKLSGIAVYVAETAENYKSLEECESPEHCVLRPVGTRQPNAFGLYDMLGNLWEWTHDWYRAFDSEESEAPVGPDQGSERVLRGCSWAWSEEWCRAAARNARPPSLRNNEVGFRPVRTIKVE